MTHVISPSSFTCVDAGCLSVLLVYSGSSSMSFGIRSSSGEVHLDSSTFTVTFVCGDISENIMPIGFVTEEQGTTLSFSSS